MVRQRGSTVRQKLVIVLLVMAILFSAASIFISFAAMNIEIDNTPQTIVIPGQSEGEGALGVGFIVGESSVNTPDKNVVSENG